MFDIFKGASLVLDFNENFSIPYLEIPYLEENIFKNQTKTRIIEQVHSSFKMIPVAMFHQFFIIITSKFD